MFRDVMSGLLDDIGCRTTKTYSVRGRGKLGLVNIFRV